MPQYKHRDYSISIPIKRFFIATPSTPVLVIDVATHTAVTTATMGWSHTFA